MRVRESGEMYLETILILRKKQSEVRAIDIVNATGYSKPSISRALGLLRTNGMLTVDNDGYIALSPAGEERAEKVYERHLVLSCFFERIGVDKKTAAEDACRIEHVISEETFDKIKKHIAEAK